MNADKNRNTMELRHGRTALTIDCGTGSILRIADVETGQVHIDAGRDGRADGRLFRLVAPHGMWWACYADSQDQPNVSCTRSDGGVTLAYPGLKAADGTVTGIGVTVDIRPARNPDEFALTMRVDNRGDRTVIDAAFPLIGGWHETSADDRFALGANSFLQPRSLSPPAGNNYARNGRRGAWFYPVELCCPWVDASKPGGGLSYINYMTEGRNGRFWIDNLAGYGDDFRLMFGWSHMDVIHPGESWTSPVMALGVHAGDWRVTADRYGDWFDALYPPDYSRPEVRSRIGFQNVFFRGFDGTPVRPLDTVPQVASDGRRHGVDMLCVWDTLTLGNYARHDPHDLTDYPQAEREQLQRGLRQAESDGTSTCALTNFRHPNVALHLPEPDLSKQIQHRYTGTVRTENWTANHTFGDLWARHIGPESFVFSPFSATHRERVLRLTGEYQDLGYTSMFYDQPFEVHPDYGFVDRGHRPDATHRDALALVGDVREKLLSRDGNTVVIGEECDIHGTRYIDQWMSWSISEPSPALLERMLMMRYSIPHTIISWVVDHQPERATVAFAMGMQLCLMVHGGEGTLADEPAFAEHVRALSELRKKTADRTVMARFRGHDGLTIDGDEAFLAFAYESASGPAVIAAAWGAEAKGRVTVNRGTFAAAGEPERGRIYRLNGSEESHSGSTMECALGINDVAVWVL